MPCPICKSPPAFDFRPFCSRRCADLDLGRWVTGAYSIPVVDDDTPENTPISDADDREH